MGLEKEFIKKGIKKAKLEEFFQEEYARAGYSGCEIRRTPMGVNITIHADKPGLIIGRGGSRIKEVTEKLEKEFGFKDPQLDVKEIEKPELNATIMANEIKNAMERGASRRRVANGVLRSIMERGAAGAEIRISGKLSGSRGRAEKFADGYLKSCGEPAQRLVDEAVVHAKTKPGTIGVRVRIMERKPEGVGEEKKEEEKGFELGDETVESIVSGSIRDGKEKIEELAEELEEEQYEKLLDCEKEGKDRKGMKKYLKERIGKEEGE